MYVTRRVRQSVGVPALVALAGIGSLVAIALYAPTRMYGVESPANLIAYWHIALAWTAGVAFLVTTLASVQFLRKRERSWNLLAGASAEVGFLMLTATLVMGSLWARVIWGVYWSWSDVRLVTLFIAWFVYAGYLVVFSSTLDSEERFAAVYAILGFVTVPLSYLSTRLWQPELHTPTIGGGGESAIDPGVLVLSILAITLLYAFLASVRVGVLECRDEVVRQRRDREP
ncbi:MAG TPA: cytochrome c biogenesis protein CcsA [Natrialbaceae archaeon]|nr:cytochrome c biogenesis protein CcsA [Natrialbaceae archaeon]